MSNEVENVLVIGGAGYTGSVLSRKLLNYGYKVRILDDFLYGEESVAELKSNSNLELIKGDIRDIGIVVKSLKNIDAVIHLAAIVGDQACDFDPDLTVETNYLATKIIAELCKHNKINRFIFASTCSVYGKSSGLSNEESPVNPISLYGVTKVKAEKALLELADSNFSPTIFRLGTLYGLSPRMRFDLVINLFIAQAVKDKKVEIFGGEQWRPFIHVADASDAYIKCLETPLDVIRGEIFNLGSDNQNFKIKDISDIIKKCIPELETNYNLEVKDKRNYRTSNKKIKDNLNFKPRKIVEDAIFEIKKVLEDGTINDYKADKHSNKLLFKSLDSKKKVYTLTPIIKNNQIGTRSSVKLDEPISTTVFK